MRPNLHPGEGHGAITGEGPEDTTGTQLGADDAGAQSNEQDERQAKRSSSALRDLAEQLSQRKPGVGGGEGVKVLDGEHEGD